MPELFVLLNWYLYCFKGMGRGDLVLWGDCVVVQETLESLPVLTLKHHFYLVPASLGFICFVRVYIQGFYVVYYSNVKLLPFCCLVFYIESKFWCFPVRSLLLAIVEVDLECVVMFGVEILAVILVVTVTELLLPDVVRSCNEWSWNEGYLLPCSWPNYLPQLGKVCC